MFAFFINAIVIETEDETRGYAQTDVAFANIRARFDDRNSTYPYLTHLLVC